VRARVDTDHWITSGSSETLNALVQGDATYSPLKLDQGGNPVVFVGAEDLVVSDHPWDENRLQLAFKPMVMVQEHGRGRVIGFVGDPTYRAYLDGLNVLLVNAVFRGPAR
jgi:hypothetical protein